MSVNSYPPGQLPSDDLVHVLTCLNAAGFTNVTVGVDLDGTLHCHVDEEVSSESMQTQLEAAHVEDGALSYDVLNPLSILGDGATSVVLTLTDPRGAAAEGKTAKLQMPKGVYVPVNGDQFVMDNAGEAEITFGPLLGCLQDVDLTFYYEDEAVDAISLVLSFGSG